VAIIRCLACETEFLASVERWHEGSGSKVDPEDSLSGTITCGECGTENIFRERGGVIEYRHDPDMFGTLPPQTSKIMRSLYQEAIDCFVNRTFRASAGMCRSTLEQTLEEHGYKRGSLESKIDAAKKDGILDDEQVAVAHGSRLMGNRALHRAAKINPGHAQAALGAAGTLVEHIMEAVKARKEPEVQSGTDSNED